MCNTTGKLDVILMLMANEAQTACCGKQGTYCLYNNKHIKCSQSNNTALTSAWNSCGVSMERSLKFPMSCLKCFSVSESRSALFHHTISQLKSDWRGWAVLWKRLCVERYGLRVSMRGLPWENGALRFDKRCSGGKEGFLLEMIHWFHRAMPFYAK